MAESALPGIDADQVGNWLAGHVDGLDQGSGPVKFELVSGGRSNLTYRVTGAAGATYALQRPPTGGVLSTAHDVSREWRFISALAPTAVPVPAPVAYCADTAVTGAEFYVMGFVEGLVLADSEAGLTLASQARTRVERLLRRWHAQAGGIVHGDYRAGNVAFGPDGAIRAVFDAAADHARAEHRGRFPRPGAAGAALRPAIRPGRVEPAVLGGVLAVAVGMHRRRRTGPLPGRAHG